MKDELIKLLQEDQEVRSLIRDIIDNKEVEVTQKQDQETNYMTMLKELISEYSDKTINLGEEKDMDKIIIKIKELLTKLFGDKKQLKKDNNSVISANNKLKGAITQIEEEKVSLTEENKTLSMNNKDLDDKIDFYRKNFQEDLEVFDLYQELSEDTKSSLKGIFKNTTLKGLIACGVQEKNITSLWDYIKDEIIEERYKDIDNLKRIFDLLFLRYNLAQPLYERQTVSEGEVFDTALHIRHSSSEKVSGEINSIELKGWVNSKNSKIIKKSIVKMG